MSTLLYNLLRVLAVTMIVPCVSYGQLFESKQLLQEGLLGSQIVWGDFDKNDSLEVLYTGTSSTGALSAMIIKNIWRSNPQFHPINIQVLKEGAVAVSDMNNNGLQDLLVSGKDGNGIARTIFYINRDGFDFEEASFSFEGLHSGNILIADFNNDGEKDLFINGYDQQGVPKVHFYKKLASGFSVIETDVVGLGEGTSLVLDFNKDGLTDILLTGIDTSGKKRNILYKNDGSFKFSIAQEFIGLSSGNGAIGDFNHDGFPDFIIAGNNEENVKTTSLYLYESENYVLSNITLDGLSEGQVFIADMNHDGLADIILSGNIEAGNFKTKLYYGNSRGIDSQEGISVLEENVIAIGDANNDGNLDLINMGISDAQLPTILYYHNLTAEPNMGPSGAVNPFVLPMRNKAFFSWEPAIDDATPSKALTYDVMVFKEDKGKKVPDANTETGYRRTVAHGTQHQDTSWFMTGLQEGIYDWAVFSVDNAFKGNGGDGICQGGSFRMCFEISSADTTICEKGPLIFNLEAGPQHIYSVNNGYLGIHNDFSYEVVKSDTLYFVSTDPMVCTSSLELAIQLVPEENPDLGEDMRICKGEEITLELAPNFEPIKWRVNGEDKGNEPIYSALILQPSEIIVEAFNSIGCITYDTIFIDIYPDFQIQVSDDVTIANGESIVLFASGGTSYSWSPKTGLSDSEASNPTVNPENTTTYYVTAKNDVGCETTDSIKVSVQTNLFIPNLFTPNGDGNNENFKIYGNNFNDLVFQVFDRSGNLVYEGRNNDPFSRGWDGYKNGQPQPSGAYIWRLQGKNKDGSMITYQGKNSGTINLIR